MKMPILRPRAKGRCIARFNEILELYSGVRVAYECTIGYDSSKGFGTINFWGPWATYTWDGETDTPTMTFLQDKDGHLAWQQYIFKPFLPAEESPCYLRYGNLPFTIQEISKLPEITKEASMGLAIKHLHHWEKERCEKYLDHLMDCGRKLRRHHQMREREIAENGFCEDHAIDLS